MHNKSRMKHFRPARLTASSFKLAAFLSIFIFASAGCAGKNQLEQAKNHVRDYEANYNAAVALYKELIKQGKDLQSLHFALGQLYFSHSDFLRAKEEFGRLDSQEARKLAAICNYHLGDFSEALKIFDESESLDNQALYYAGLTGEKLNLYDKALSQYKKIKSGAFRDLAGERIGKIEKQTSSKNIREVSPFVDKILSGAPDPQKYPQAGALILFCDEKVEVTPDNKQISELHYVVRILNERGKEGFSEAHIEYDSTFEKVELEYARTIKPDGTVADVGLSHIRDVTKYLNFPLYSNARIYIISFPEIAEGASIEYRLKIIRNQLVNKKDFVMSYPVQSSEPIISANFSIELPKGKNLYIKNLNGQYNNFGARLEASVEEKGDKAVYRWQFKDIPQIIPEANMPAQVEINPIMLFSTFNKWDDIYNWWWSLAKDKMFADDAIKTKTKELCRGLDSPEDRVKRIYNFCARQIRYVAVEYGQAGYEPHKASDIFKNKYGDCKDQAILLVTMLREEGFSAWPVLIGTREYYNLNEDFPSMLFNHCIAAVSLQDKTIFLDPTAETCSWGDLPADDQGRRVLSCSADGYKIENTPLFPAQHNLARQTLDIEIRDDESINAQKKIFTTGMYDQAQRYWLLYTVPELIRDELEEKIQSVSIGARLDNYNIENLDNLDKNIELSYGFRGPEYFTDAGQLRVLPQLASLDTSLVSKDRRRYPIDFGVLDTKDIELKLRLPANFVIKYMPEDINEDSQWMKFTVNYKKQGKELIFIQKTELKKTSISAEQYAEFKKFFEGLAKKIKQRIVLEKGK